MFFILSKTLGLLLNPLVLLIILLLPALFLKKPLLKRIFLAAFAFFSILFTNPFITNEVMEWWEVPPVPFKSLTKPYSTAIVLSGVTVSDKSPHDRVYFSKGADRVMHAVQLYKTGKVHNLLLSGGSGSLEADTVTEAERMRRVMLLSGVPDSVILVEGKSRNTHENALFTKQMLDSIGQEQHYLLVTSAFHMRRAQACFEHEGLQTDAFTTDFYSSDTPYGLDSFLLPRAEAIVAWDKLIREWVGLLMYKISGYA
ncbi:YdcF family protein [Cesiribacter sp. SM1]|uniref:YdcF family protein n=1 Tax=Cesiribacter sp. SM1 TaxID=2861196 RepID=UPI001CD3963D|nr:YdcF family protein [Cesiribacter sp. SM1]